MPIAVIISLNCIGQCKNGVCEYAMGTGHGHSLWPPVPSRQPIGTNNRLELELRSTYRICCSSALLISDSTVPARQDSISTGCHAASVVVIGYAGIIHGSSDGQHPAIVYRRHVSPFWQEMCYRSSYIRYTASNSAILHPTQIKE